MKDNWYQKKWQRIPLFFLFFLVTLILVLNVGGEIYNGQSILIKVTGNYLLNLSQATYTFDSDNLVAGNFDTYDGLKTNYVLIYCFDATNKIFLVKLITNSNV